MPESHAETPGGLRLPGAGQVRGPPPRAALLEDIPGTEDVPSAHSLDTVHQSPPHVRVIRAVF